MKRDISSQVAQIPRFSRAQLLELWQKLHQRAAPAGIRRELMVPCLAYRIQENAFGGLKPATRAQLRRIATGLKKNPLSEMLVRPRVKPGTRLLRNWRGQVHEVFVTDAGFEYRGIGYRSLSEVARKITGTRWSGPAFFGLNNAKSKAGRLDE